MANVGNAAIGMVLQGTGVNSGPTYEDLGVNSGLTANGVVIAQNNDAFTATSSGTPGQVLTSNGSGSDPSFQTPSSGGFSWNIASASHSMSVNNGYVSSATGLVVLTLPSTAAFGSIIRVVANGGSGWQIAQNSGQTIHFGNLSTTLGVLGFLQSVSPYDAIELLCTVTDTDFTVINGPQGNITYN
jgi:hypothetical protein